MKLKHLLTIMSALILSILIASCSTQQIQNMNSEPVPAGLTTEQVKQAIIKAGKTHEWAISDIGNNKLEAKLIYDEYYIDVEIPYTTDNYSILYKDSYELDYNKDENSIHKTYNKWINYLNKNIQKQLLIQEAQNREAKFNK